MLYLLTCEHTHRCMEAVVKFIRGWGRGKRWTCWTVTVYLRLALPLSPPLCAGLNWLYGVVRGALFCGLASRCPLPAPLCAHCVKGIGVTCGGRHCSPIFVGPLLLSGACERTFWNVLLDREREQSRKKEMKKRAREKNNPDNPSSYIRL